MIGISAPAGMSTSMDDRILTLPRPEQSPHWAPRGTTLPVPWQAVHVLAIWNPLSITKVRVPVPLHSPQADFLAPALRPDPVHVWQSTTGVMLSVRFAPRQDSRKVILADDSMSSPMAISARRPPRPRPAPNPEPKRCSKMSGPA
jgi:hypothetical protein